MATLAELPDLVGFFSYSRDDDIDSDGALSKIREQIQRELRMLLGRKGGFRIWQDHAAIPQGSLWEKQIRAAIAQSVFFIPIITPTAINSRYCRVEFELFLAREKELGREDLVHPILYIPVPALKQEALWRKDEVLKVIGERQYSDWQELRRFDVGSIEHRRKIQEFCQRVYDTLDQTWADPRPSRLVAGTPAAAPDRDVPRTNGPMRVAVPRGASTATPPFPGRIAPPPLTPRPDPSSDAISGIGARMRHWLRDAWFDPVTRRSAISALTIGFVLLAGALTIWAVTPRQQRIAGDVMQAKPEVTPVPKRGAPPHISEQLVATTPLTPAQERSLTPGQRFKECGDCPEMIVIRPGSFLMGSNKGVIGHHENEWPVTPITFSRRSAVGQYAVTFDEWNACVAGQGCRKVPDNGWGGRRPAIYISWADANAYLAWLSKRTDRSYRLPSDAEREYFTRAGNDKDPFWWGPSISADQANYRSLVSFNGGPTADWRERTVPVDRFDPNPWGLYQVHGNVWEWTQDCYYPTLESIPRDGTAREGIECTRRVKRGGSWHTTPVFLRSSTRFGAIAEDRIEDIGFRVVRSLLP